MFAHAGLRAFECQSQDFRHFPARQVTASIEEGVQWVASRRTAGQDPRFYGDRSTGREHIRLRCPTKRNEPKYSSGGEGYAGADSQRDPIVATIESRGRPLDDDGSDRPHQANPPRHRDQHVVGWDPRVRALRT